MDASGDSFDQENGFGWANWPVQQSEFATAQRKATDPYHQPQGQWDPVQDMYQAHSHIPLTNPADLQNPQHAEWPMGKQVAAADAVHPQQNVPQDLLQDNFQWSNTNQQFERMGSWTANHPMIAPSISTDIQTPSLISGDLREGEPLNSGPVPFPSVTHFVRSEHSKLQPNIDDEVLLSKSRRRRPVNGDVLKKLREAFNVATVETDCNILDLLRHCWPELGLTSSVNANSKPQSIQLVIPDDISDDYKSEHAYAIKYVRCCRSMKCGSKPQKYDNGHIPCPKKDCTKSFKLPVELQRHLEYSDPYNFIQCPKCHGSEAKFFYRMDTAAAHLKHFHKMEKADAKRAADTAQTYTIAFYESCPLKGCNQVFSDFYDLYRKHYPSHFRKPGAPHCGDGHHGQGPSSGNDDDGDLSDDDEDDDDAQGPGCTGSGPSQRRRDNNIHRYGSDMQHSRSSNREPVGCPENSSKDGLETMLGGLCYSRADQSSSKLSTTQRTENDRVSWDSTESHTRNDHGLNQNGTTSNIAANILARLHSLQISGCPQVLISKHETGGIYQCVFCHSSFDDVQTWAKHLNNRDPEAIWRCGPCGQLFNLFESLELHLYQYPDHWTTHLSSPDPDTTCVYSGRQERTCGFCGELIYDWSDFWRQHVAGHFESGEDVKEWKHDRCHSKVKKSSNTKRIALKSSECTTEAQSNPPPPTECEPVALGGQNVTTFVRTAYTADPGSEILTSYTLSSSIITERDAVKGSAALDSLPRPIEFDWLLAKDWIQDCWSRKEVPTLWLRENPGIGKSALRRCLDIHLGASLSQKIEETKDMQISTHSKLIALGHSVGSLVALMLTEWHDRLFPDQANCSNIYRMAFGNSQPPLQWYIGHQGPITQIHAACDQNYMDVVELLLNRGADVNGSRQVSPRSSSLTDTYLVSYDTSKLHNAMTVSRHKIKSQASLDELVTKFTSIALWSSNGTHMNSAMDKHTQLLATTLDAFGDPALSIIRSSPIPLRWHYHTEFFNMVHRDFSFDTISTYETAVLRRDSRFWSNELSLALRGPNLHRESGLSTESPTLLSIRRDGLDEPARLYQIFALCTWEYSTPTSQASLFKVSLLQELESVFCWAIVMTSSSQIYTHGHNQESDARSPVRLTMSHIFPCWSASTSDQCKPAAEILEAEGTSSLTRNNS